MLSPLRARGGMQGSQLDRCATLGEDVLDVLQHLELRRDGDAARPLERTARPLERAAQRVERGGTQRQLGRADVLDEQGDGVGAEGDYVDAVSARELAQHLQHRHLRVDRRRGRGLVRGVPGHPRQQDRPTVVYSPCRAPRVYERTKLDEMRLRIGVAGPCSNAAVRPCSSLVWTALMVIVGRREPQLLLDVVDGGSRAGQLGYLRSARGLGDLEHQLAGRPQARLSSGSVTVSGDSIQ